MFDTNLSRLSACRHIRIDNAHPKVNLIYSVTHSPDFGTDFLLPESGIPVPTQDDGAQLGNPAVWGLVGYLVRCPISSKLGYYRTSKVLLTNKPARVLIYAVTTKTNKDRSRLRSL
jgi:hypothetical protein